MCVAEGLCHQGAGMVQMPGSHSILVPCFDIITSSTFLMVGVVFRGNDRLATETHLSPQMQAAMATTRRLRALDVLCALLWCTVVLPQCLYGCEVRNLTPRNSLPSRGPDKLLLLPRPPICQMYSGP